MVFSAYLLAGFVNLDVYKDLSVNIKTIVLYDRNFILCFTSWILFLWSYVCLNVSRTTSLLKNYNFL